MILPSLNQHPRKRFDPYADGEAMPEFQVAPMVDVLLVLLLFFMATATAEVMVRPADLELPKADAALDQIENSGLSVISISRTDAQILLGEELISTPERLVPLLQKARESDRLLRGTPAGSYRVLIRADKETNYSLIKQIMQACARAGIANVTFAVLRSGEKNLSPESTFQSP